MKNMVSGRNSYRNRKNIVFGKIPKKNRGSNFFRSSKIFRRSKIFRSTSRKKFGHPKKYFFDRNLFRCRKKISTDFFVNHFSLSKNKFETTFFLDLIFTCKILTATHPPPPQTFIPPGQDPLYGFGPMQGESTKCVSVTFWRELDGH